ncbi:conserved hypothetical protein [Neospora caninum Liverpool]|uniref:Uncharacterized protein n=1 Tax=Neospora caninum (strain Liverpool) TaxID=572307 RepID=F0VEV0_NEOCL|nr:conserved hypothetical protein [Neospora caninum Liverpool]CBZ52244.1 conserved hypothetical protein [Neospora caninum Liverpool]CEL66212.1 TPA: hypothetical protein BN1204_020300 [Neospora caninum Liverpool]|eukprot:XP_003882276.1 conserved hypothetical protein [Neospora caninum Liverpool]
MAEEQVAAKYREMDAIPKTVCEDTAEGVATSEVQEIGDQWRPSKQPECRQEKKQEPELTAQEEEREHTKEAQRETECRLGEQVAADQGSPSARKRASDSVHSTQPTRLRESSSTEKHVVLEYEPVADRKTQKTGSALIDSLNSFLDTWLVPDEDAAEDPHKIVNAAVTGNVECAPQDRCKGEEAVSLMTLVKSVQLSCPLLDLHDSHPACPACHQPLPGEKTPPTQSWTRWVFKQCEEPLDIQSEFLVYPNPLVYVGRQKPNIDEPWFGTVSYVPS